MLGQLCWWRALKEAFLERSASFPTSKISCLSVTSPCRGCEETESEARDFENSLFSGRLFLLAQVFGFYYVDSGQVLCVEVCHVGLSGSL